MSLYVVCVCVCNTFMSSDEQQMLLVDLTSLYIDALLVSVIEFLHAFSNDDFMLLSNPSRRRLRISVPKAKKLYDMQSHHPLRLEQSDGLCPALP